MSADNYITVRKFSDGWRYAMGWLSACDPCELPDEKFAGSLVFPSAEEAARYADREYDLLEYGVYIDPHPEGFLTDPAVWLVEEFGAEIYDAHEFKSVSVAGYVGYMWYRGTAMWTVGRSVCRKSLTRDDVRRLCEIFGVEVKTNE
jgi:hypothetical protein